MAVSSEKFKKALSLWASGVSVICYESKAKKGGITVSSFSSVSLEPPLVLFCLDKNSPAKEAIESANAFSVNILSSEQKQISADFASSSLDKEEVLAGQNPIRLVTGAPVLNGTLASLDCSLFQILDSGDHWIMIGHVEDSNSSENAPLLYFNRNYHTI